MLNAEKIYPHNTPTTKEGYYYRMIFERFFPQVIDYSPDPHQRTQFFRIRL